LQCRLGKIGHPMTERPPLVAILDIENEDKFVKNVFSGSQNADIVIDE